MLMSNLIAQHIVGCHLKLTGQPEPVQAACRISSANNGRYASSTNYSVSDTGLIPVQYREIKKLSGTKTMYSLFKPPSPISSAIAATISTDEKADSGNLNTDALLSEIYGDDYVINKPFEHLESIETIPVTQDHNPSTTTDSLPSDQLIHTAETSYQCQHCPRKFNQSSRLKRHIRIHSSETSYECQYCGKRFIVPSKLTVHLRIHTNEKPHECQHCGKTFNQKIHLTRHLRLHTGETPYECRHCSKKFSASTNLRRHLLIHTGETPYECLHCNRKFKRQSSLRRHLRIHTGETPYECLHCNRKFKQPSTLKKHLRIHTGETPYKCQHCNRKFKRPSTLKRHLGIHTGETPCECQHCNKEFNESSSLKMCLLWIHSRDSLSVLALRQDIQSVIHPENTPADPH